VIRNGDGELMETGLLAERERITVLRRVGARIRTESCSCNRQTKFLWSVVLRAEIRGRASKSQRPLNDDGRCDIISGANEKRFSGEMGEEARRREAAA